MWISKLTLSNFRNYDSLDLELSPRPMIFHGANAQGKSNLLEAIWVLTTTKSHRATNERELLRWAAAEEPLPVARLYGEVQRARDNITLEIGLKLEQGDYSTFLSEGSGVARKRIRVNGIVRRAMDVVGQANAVIFSAHDLDLITGPPSLRRRHLDLINSQVDSHYLRCLQKYHRVLLQRNRLLSLIQQHEAQPAQLEFWDKELAENGAYLTTQRQCLVSAINELSTSIHDRLSAGTERLRLAYLPNIGSENVAQAEVEAKILNTLHKVQLMEISRGMTLTGPHRDELQFLVNDINIGTYGSRGQQRTVALSLKLAEASYLRDQADDAPILLLDDILSELDQSRRRHLLETIISSQQVLITTTDLDHFDPAFLAQAVQFRVKEGHVERI